MVADTKPVEPTLVVLPGGRNQHTLVAIAQSAIDETHMELEVSRDERIAHTSAVRQHVRASLRALTDGRLAMAGMWLLELERLNEREANRARAAETAAQACPDGIDQIGHGKAA